MRYSGVNYQQEPPGVLPGGLAEVFETPRTVVRVPFCLWTCLLTGS